MMRETLVALTDALAKRDREDVVLLDRSTWRVGVDSTLDDVDTRRARAAAFAEALVVPCPDGLWEWSVRRDFVRSARKLVRGAPKDPAADDVKKLAATLAGTRTKRRFEVALGSVRDRTLVRAFALYRRRRIRAWAARVLHAVLGGWTPPTDEAEVAVVTAPRRKRTRTGASKRRRPGRKRRSRFVSYVA